MTKRFFKRAICVFVMSVLMLSGCQPTPAKPVVVNKADGKLEEKIQATPAPTLAYEAPAHWSETVEGDKLNIVINTDIKMPDVRSYPVVKLEPASFTQQQVDDMVYYFAGDAKLYLPQVKTKADYDELIVQAKMGQNIDGKYVVNEQSKAAVKELENMRAAAPDDSPIIYTDTTLIYPKNDTDEDVTERGKNSLSVMFMNKDGGEGRIWVDNYSSTYFSFLNDDTFYVIESAYQDMLANDTTEEENGWTGAGALFDKVPITLDDAQAKAEQVIGDLNIKELMLVTAEKAVSPDAPEKCGYRFVFTRESGSIPVFWFEGGGYSNEEEPPAYSPPFTEETLEIIVSRYGIESFAWNGYAHVVESVSDNVELLPFEDIQQSLEKQIFYKKSFCVNDYMTDNYVATVTSAELRIGYIDVKDSADQALLVPVWVFKTTMSFDNTDLGKHQSHPDETYVLNAIDGGVIDTSRD